MASSISAGTTSATALVHTADTSGSLVLQTNNGTTALTLSTAQNATFAGAITANTIGSASATALTLQSAGTTAVTIDTSQNVGIGTTSPSVKFQVNHSSDVAAIKGSGGGVTLGLSNSSANDVLQRMTNNSNNFWDIRNVYSSSNFVIAYNGNDRITIDTSGNFAVSANNSTNAGIQMNPSGYMGCGNSAGSSGFGFITFYRSGSNIGNITQNGTTAVAYNTSSDYRLKENIALMTGALAKVAALKPCTYTWKSAPEEAGEGFIAHELAEVCPHAVTGTKDAVDADGNPVYQGIDTSFLVAILTAAIQELTAKVTALEAQVGTPA